MSELIFWALAIAGAVMAVLSFGKFAWWAFCGAVDSATKPYRVDDPKADINLLRIRVQILEDRMRKKK
jgi:hypothetical protein